jgi:transposase
MKIICQTAFKNDKIDSFKIMQLLSRNYLPTSYQPTHEERHLRERVRWRAGLVRKSTSIKNAIKAVLAKENISLKNPYSTKGRKQLTNFGMSVQHREILQDMFQSLDSIESSLAVQNKWLKEQSSNDSRVELLKTIPGIGDVSAISFLAEVGNIERFNKASQLASYIGLVPRLSESADKRRTGRITKEGSPLLRWILVQDAWKAIGKSRELKRRYSSISRRRGTQIAIVAIARMIVEISFHVLRDRKPFCESILTKEQD